jgi:hypothetical protein
MAVVALGGTVKLSRLASVNMFLLAAVLWALVVFGLATLVTSCSAQTGGWVFSERGSARPHGMYIVGWNTTGSQIADGTIVMADTSGASTVPQIALGKGFKTWNATATQVDRILGVLLGNVPGYAQGRIMVKGFHPAVKLDKTGITALSILKPSLTHAGRLTNWALAETTEAGSWWKPRVGNFQRYAYVDSLVGYCEFDFRNGP